MKKKTIYVGCSLTHAPEEFKDAITQLKAELGKYYDVIDFLGLERGTAKDAFEHDIDCVRRCDLFVAECSHPSTGLGYEIGTAVSLNKPVLAVAHESAKVTRLIQGVTHPNYTFRRYDDMEEVLEFVKEKLNSIM
jgi:nucleoside 2-deoxyribosyltransferase